VPFRFLFDAHVSGPAGRALRERGLDVVHAIEAGLWRADDADLLTWAAAEGRIVVKRNYRDFAPLVAARSAAGESFPGVLFLPTSIPPADVGAHVLALERWVAEQAAVDPEGAALGRSPVADSFGWLPAP
jgi:predicted nuclease of predicted toxin-antitoxin system